MDSPSARPAKVKATAVVVAVVEAAVDVAKAKKVNRPAWIWLGMNR